MADGSAFIQALVLNAVRRYIAEAIRSGYCLSASECAAEIIRTYPNCDMPERELVNEIIVAAAKAGVAVQIGAAGDGTGPARTYIRG